MTSPCSVPVWLRGLLPIETPAQQDVCRQHDHEYSLGGSHALRLRRDLKFCLGLLDADMHPDMAEQYFWGVRMYGGLHWPGGDRPGSIPQPPPDAEAP